MTRYKHSAIFFALIASAFSASPRNPSYNGLALVPSLGWDTWNAFHCDISADLIIGTAKLIVDYGLRDLGYVHINIDDCWSNGRYDNGTLRPDLNKFPNGMKAVGDALHDMNLKFGIYSSAGVMTCGHYEGSLGKEDIDAKTFAEWGVDYLKYDNCFNNGEAGSQKLSSDRFRRMSDALNKTGRPIVYALDNWGEDSTWNWAPTQANHWRMAGPVYDSFSRPDARCPCTGDEAYSCSVPGIDCSVLNIMNKMASIVSRIQPGCQADMDMLEVGNGGMTDDEYKTHMSIWALNSSPLIMGNDLRRIDAPTLSILSNPAVLAINQDPSSTAAARIWRFFVDDKDEWGQGEIALWVRKLNNSDLAVALVNAGNTSRVMNATLIDMFIDSGRNSEMARMGYDIYDLWANRMDNATANAVLNSTSPTMSSNDSMRYNASTTSYADGLKANVTALMGQKIGSVDPLGTLTAHVPRHGVGFFRLRPNGKTMATRDEL